MPTAGEQPKELLSRLLLRVHISRSFKTESESRAFVEAKGFLVFKKLLLLLSHGCTARAIPKVIDILQQDLTCACMEWERLPGALSITSYPCKQTLSSSNAKVNLSRILTLVRIPTAVKYKWTALERCVTQRIFSVPIFTENKQTIKNKPHAHKQTNN